MELIYPLENNFNFEKLFINFLTYFESNKTIIKRNDDINYKIFNEFDFQEIDMVIINPLN